MITNAPYNFKILDFGNDINDCIEKWYNYLEDLSQNFYNPLLFKTFINRFIIRNYDRYISTLTTEEFKIRFNDYLLSIYERAKRLENLNKKDLELFFNSYNISENEMQNILESEIENNGKNSNSSWNNNESKNSNTSSNWNSNNVTEYRKNQNGGSDSNITNTINYHSDTPKSKVLESEIKNKKYVTDVNENNNTNIISKNSFIENNGTSDIMNLSVDNSENNNTSNSLNINDTTLKNTTNQNSKNNQKTNTKNYGYNGNTKQLLNDYLSFSLDIINFYLDEAENYGLFLKILY